MPKMVRHTKGEHIIRVYFKHVCHFEDFENEKEYRIYLFFVGEPARRQGIPNVFFYNF